MKNKLTDESWVPHTKDELDKEMNRQKQLAQQEQQAVEELKKIHSNVTSGALRKKQVSVDEQSSSARGVTGNMVGNVEEEKSRSDGSNPERKVAEHPSGGFQQVREKQESTGDNTSTLRAEISTGEPPGTNKESAGNLAQDRVPPVGETERAPSRRTLWKFLCCAVVEESK
jgi:hypothetical protein